MRGRATRVHHRSSSWRAERASDATLVLTRTTPLDRAKAIGTEADPVRLEKYHKINKYHIELLAYFLGRLRATPDGTGNLLDHAMILHGSGLNDGDRHDHVDLTVPSRSR